MDGRRISHLRAMSLLEVLIALCIISIGLLAQAKMQLVALSHTQFARQHSRALIYASAMAEAQFAHEPISLEKTLKQQLPQANIEQSHQQITISWFDPQAFDQRSKISLQVSP